MGKGRGRWGPKLQGSARFSHRTAIISSNCTSPHTALAQGHHTYMASHCHLAIMWIWSDSDVKSGIRREQPPNHILFEPKVYLK